MTYEEKIEALEEEVKDAAFPFPINHSDICVIKGLTKREYFAAMALQGLLASSWQKVNPSSEFLGKMCTNAADNLIKALNE
jgi:hypothetical protein